MKKLAAIIFAGLLVSTAAFAKPKYNGDAQVHVGLAFDEFNWSYSGSSLTSDAVLFNLDAQSWNLFELNDLISVGFMAGVDFGWGGVSKVTSGNRSDSSSDCKDAFHWNIIAAPAVAFSFKPLKLQCSLGFDVGIVPGYCFGPGKGVYTSFPLTFGFVTEVQAKFFPDKKFSPICGYRFYLTGAGRVNFYDRDSKTSTERDIDTGLQSSGILYVGASFNW